MTTITKTEAAAQIAATFAEVGEVEKFPCRTIDDTPCPFYALLDSQGRPVGKRSVGKDYTPHQYGRDLAPIVDLALGAFESIGNVRAWWSGTGHVVRILPSDQYRREVYGTDTLVPCLQIRADYFGSPMISVGGYRDLCSNLHMLSMVRGTTAKLRHTSGLPIRAEIVQRQIRDTLAAFDGTMTKVREAAGQVVNLADFYREVYPMSAAAAEGSGRANTIQRNRLDALVARLMRERRITGTPAGVGTNQATAWEAYNSVQGYEQHEASPSVTGTEERIERAATAPAVRRAEALAFA